MLDYANSGGMMASVMSCLGFDTDELPPDNYQASGKWTSLVGATLNGDWEIRVADLWPIDNGYIFSWSIAFDPTIVQDCSGPPIQ
jgi:subtilisin-like proprotein convertase family protein